MVWKKSRAMSHFPCKYRRMLCYSIIPIHQITDSTANLSHRLFICDLYVSLFVCPSDLSSASTAPSIFTLQTNLQPNSHPIRIFARLQCSFLQPLTHMVRCREKKKRKEEHGGEILSRLNTAMPLVSCNLLEVLSQVLPVHSCIPFRSLKIAQKVYKWWWWWGGEQYNLFEKCQKWKMEIAHSIGAIHHLAERLRLFCAYKGPIHQLHHPYNKTNWLPL